LEGRGFVEISQARRKNLVYYFDSSTTPNAFWVDLRKINFSKDAPAMKLNMGKGQVYSGDVSASFKTATPFKFLPGVGATQ